MKKRGLLLVLGLLICMVICGGCEKKESADDYLGRYITRAKEKQGELTGVLEDGIVNIKDTEELVIDFPEELKESYEEFLKDALNQVQFELNKAEKESDDTYMVRVTYDPIDIAATTDDTNLEYVKNISSTDFCAEVNKLLEKDRELLESSENQQKKSRIIEVQKSGDGFAIDEAQIKDLLEDALQGYMAPYAAVAKVFDMRDFVQAYLDANIKSEFEQYIEHTGMSAEEVSVIYDDSFSEFRMDELSSEQNDRFVNAAKVIYRNCQYSVGIMKQNSLTEYVFDITVTPNTSIINAMNEFEAGTYYSESAAKEALLNIYDKYAASPTYGEETTITVTWNTIDMLNSQAENEEFNRLMDTIIPAE